MNYKKPNHVDKTLNVYDLAIKIKIKSRTGEMVMPVVEPKTGEWLRDTTLIIEALESRHPDHPIVVETPLQYTVSLLLEAWINEYWLPVAKANGSSLHAGVSCEGHERSKRERPGGVPPVDFMARLAALVPKPRVKITGTPSPANTASLPARPGPKHRWRGEVTPAKRGEGASALTVQSASTSLKTSWHELFVCSRSASYFDRVSQVIYFEQAFDIYYTLRN